MNVYIHSIILFKIILLLYISAEWKKENITEFSTYLHWKCQISIQYIYLYVYTRY